MEHGNRVNRKMLTIIYEAGTAQTGGPLVSALWPPRPVPSHFSPLPDKRFTMEWDLSNSTLAFPLRWLLSVWYSFRYTIDSTFIRPTNIWSPVLIKKPVR